SVMTSTPERRIWSPPMPKMAAPVRAFSAAARLAAYISPLASPAERRICGAGIVGLVFSRSRAAAMGRMVRARSAREARAVPALYIAAGTGGSRCRATQEALDGRLVRAGGLYGRQ